MGGDGTIKGYFYRSNEKPTIGGVRFDGIEVAKYVKDERNMNCVWTNVGYLEYPDQTSGQAVIQRVANSEISAEDNRKNPLPDILSINNMESGTMVYNDAPFRRDEYGQIECDANGVPLQDENAAPTINGIATISAQRGATDFKLDAKDGKSQRIMDTGIYEIVADEGDVVRDMSYLHDLSDAYKSPKPQLGL